MTVDTSSQPASAASLTYATRPGVEIVILDEFQHFIDSDSNTVLVNVSNWLKDLINETKKPVVLVGMPHSEVVLRANPQLERRFSMRESLEPFGWAMAEERDEFKAFLEHLDSLLPLPQRSNLNNHETAFRIYCATNGFIGYVMKLVRRAAVMAIDRSVDCLGPELLAESYDERLAAGALGHVNPFRAELSDLEIKAFPEVHYVAKRSNRRSKAKATRHTSSDVLTRKK